MKIKDGTDFANAEKQERANIRDYLDQLALWTYRFINTDNKATLTRVRARYEDEIDGWVELEKMTPEDIWIVALAGRYYKPNFPQGDTRAEEEFADYQFQLQSYLWITQPEIVVKFYDELVSNVKPEHNKLIPILHVHHAQIHALKIAYDALKWKMWKNPSLTTRAIFGLICVEFMKLQVRLYLIEPLARTEKWKELDWIFMLDKVFADFSSIRNADKEAFRRVNGATINPYESIGLWWVFKHIKDIRDEVDALKRKKLWIPGERKARDLIPQVNPIWYMRVVQMTHRRFWNGKI